MAENKRQSVGGKGQGQGLANASAAMVPSDETLGKAIGARYAKCCNISS